MSVFLRSAASPYLLFGVFAVFVLLDSGTDLIEEFSSGESIQAMIDDLVLFSLSVLVVLKISADLMHQHRSVQELKNQLERAKGQLAKEDKPGSQLATEYRKVVQHQFKRWKLTPSEEDVSVCLLKGLSFREIAVIRNTSERTVRQQAAVVYKKAGLSGRHELAAWFFEDMLALADTDKL